MNIQLQQIVGTWRHVNGDILIDFHIRSISFGEEFTRAMFTIYNSEPENNILFEWHGEIEIINSANELPKIQINEIHRTGDKPEYENLSIWMFTAPNEMYLQLGNGDRVLFKKLGTFFSQ